MDYREGLFFETFIPCSDERLAEIEASLGLQLPGEYRELLRQTGGGWLAHGRDHISVPEISEDYIEGVSVILGNTSNDRDPDSIVYSPELMGPECWGAPEGLLIFSISESGPHVCFGINYGEESFPHLSIVHVDVELGNIMTKVADTFGEFIGMLDSYEALHPGEGDL